MCDGGGLSRMEGAKRESKHVEGMSKQKATFRSRAQDMLVRLMLPIATMSSSLKDEPSHCCMAMALLLPVVYSC